MPIRIQKPNPNSAADWASHLPAPLQRVGGAALSGLQSVFGSEDPNTIMGVAAPMISIYPNKLAREAGTKSFLSSAVDTGISGIDVAAELFAEKFPRIAAHMRLLKEPSFTAPGRALTRNSGGKVTAPLEIRLAERQPYPLNILGHEGTHVAQALGNRKAFELYKKANANPNIGYYNNPIEWTANYKGNQLESVLPGAYGYTPSYNIASRPPKTAIEMLKALGIE